MNAWIRLWRHLRSTKTGARRAFPPATLQAVQMAIASGENLHRAEVRVIIEPALRLSAIFNHVPARQRAHELFRDVGMWDTEENCGVLLYINLADRKIEIIADRGISKLVHASDWHSLCAAITKGFARGAYHDSLLDGLQQLNQLLQTHLPAHGAHVNQLSNRPLII